MNLTIRNRIEQIKIGQVPEGYKKTALGIFPEDWKSKEIKKTCKINPKSEKLANTFLYLDLESVTDGKIIAKNIIDKKNAPSRAQRVLRNGDVIFQMVRPYQKNNYIYKQQSSFQVVASTGYAQIRGNCNEFIYQVINSFYFRKQVLKKCTGTNYPAINSSDFAKTVICQPQSLPEQEKIAKILMLWDKAIDIQEQLLQKLNLQKKALMQILLTPKDGWGILKLNSLVSLISSGGTPSTSIDEYHNGDIIWVSIDDITSSGKYLSNSKRKITKLGLENSSARIFPQNTVLFAMYASIGACTIALKECATSQAILGIVTNEKLYYQYLYYHLLSIQEKIMIQGQKGTQANLNKKMVENFKIPLPMVENKAPDINEQKRIANILSLAGKEIVLHKQKLDKLKKQRKSLMQLLLTGIVRVV